MLIRNMTINDYEAIYDMWIHTPGMGLNDLDDSKDGIEKYLKRNPDTCFVAEENNRIVGVIMCGHDGRRGFVHHTVVVPEWRKKGLGEKLVYEALEALKREGIHKVALLVFGKNEIGNIFWEKMGFTDRTDIIYRNKCLSEIVRMDT